MQLSASYYVLVTHKSQLSHGGGKGSRRGYYYYMNNKNNPICFFCADDCLDYAEKSARSQNASPCILCQKGANFPTSSWSRSPWESPDLGKERQECGGAHTLSGATKLWTESKGWKLGCKHKAMKCVYCIKLFLSPYLFRHLQARTPHTHTSGKRGRDNCQVHTALRNEMKKWSTWSNQHVK